MTIYQVPGYGFPGRHAECFQTARMAAAFGALGLDARVVYPSLGGSIRWRDVSLTYGVDRPPPRVVLPALRPPPVRGVRRLVDGARAASLGVFARRAGAGAVFLSRHPRYEPLATLLRLAARGRLAGRVYVELHEAAHFDRALDPCVAGYIAITEGLRRWLLGAGLAAARVCVAPNAVDLDAYEAVRRSDPATLRAASGLPADRRLVCYTGGLGPGRNLETLVRAVGGIPGRPMLVIAGGGTPAEAARLQAVAREAGLAGQVVVTGHRPAAGIRACQVAADVLVVPYSSGLRHAATCSPLKLWEYRATGNPIVAFRLPALAEAVADDEVEWAEEESSEALAAAVTRAFLRPRRTPADVRAKLAGWTWVDRAARVAAFMGVPAPVAARTAVGRRSEAPA